MATLEKSLISESMDIVTYEIKIKDPKDEKNSKEFQKISKEHQMISIMVETGINKIPSATIVINDGEVDTQNFGASDSGVFSPGNEIEIALGYQKNELAENKTVFKGIIVRNTHKINNHCSELTVDCKNSVEVMTFTKVNEIFPPDSTDIDIINIILDKHLEQKQIDKPDVKGNKPIKHAQALQVNTTDWDFIMSRLDVAGLICTFPKSILTIRDIPTEKSSVGAQEQNAAPGDTAPTSKDFVLTYGRNILEFDAELDPRVESSMVRVQTWNFKTQKIETAESADQDCERDEDKQNKQNEKDAADDKKAAKKLGYEWTIATPTTIEDEVGKSIARTKKLRQCLSKIKGTVKYLGTTQVAPGAFVKIEGVGKKFDGKAFVTNIQHEYSDGCWITTAILGWDEKLFTEQTNPGHANSQTGQISSIQGLHIGKVSNIEDKDGEYRVKVKLPMVDDKSEGIYARVATLDAGKDRGTFFRPEQDDEVVLGFMSDDPANPVILGCLHSGNLKSPLEPEKNNNKKGYVSRSAIKLLFDDDRKSLTVETPGKRLVVLDDKEETISVKDDFGNKIVMGKAGITIDSAGDIIMKAKKEITATAQTQLGLKGSSGAKLEGSGPVTVQSAANTIIKGSKVLIN
jgi:Rhs element Vgr protein